MFANPFEIKTQMMVTRKPTTVISDPNKTTVFCDDMPVFFAISSRKPATDENKF